MPTFDSDGVTIAYTDEGAGPPVLLIHGFASNKTVNWRATGWVKTLTEAGYRVITIDNRGHGESQKLYDPEAYKTTLMAADAARLIDHLGLPRVVAHGYSMGARITAFLALAAPEKLAGVILSGLAGNLVHGVGGGPIAEALRAPSLESVTDRNARAFRLFADQTKSDREALAACILAARQTLTVDDLASITLPTLSVAGSEDVISGSVDELVSWLPNATGVTLPGKDHMSAVGDKGHKAAVLDFLSARAALSDGWQNP
ncbi:MAG: alpha/beta hydrolase [Pseudomonadota bacterium]